LTKPYTESIITGAVVLVIGLAFGGFQNNKTPSAEAHQNEISRLQSAAIASKAPMQAENYQKTYKKNEQLSPEDLKDILYFVGFRGKDLQEAWGVAMKESTGRPMAHNQNKATGDNSYGLFQINMIGSLGPARLAQYDLKSNEELFNPITNAKIAFEMSNGGANWKAWHGITEKTLEWMSEFPD
jgi:hypothetical protein